MSVNKQCPLVLSDLYEYDFSACGYNILQNSGWDMTDIEYSDKEKRNVEIGYLQRNNPRVAYFLHSTMENLINFYISENKLSELNDVIIRTKDSIITCKSLSLTNLTMPIEFRGVISKLIISADRKMWLIVRSDGKVDVKGIKDKPMDISFYNMFRNIDYTTSKSIVHSMEQMRQTVLKKGNLLWYCREGDDDKILLPVRNIGIIKFKRSTVGSVDISEVDKRFLWEDYMWPFCRSLMIHYGL